MLLTDIETNGLLPTVNKFHCAVTYDYTTDEYIKYRPQDFGAYIDALEAEVARGGLIVFHNGHKYDIPVIELLAKSILGRDVSFPKENVLDTLVLSRLIFANIKDTDAGLLRSGKLPGKRFGSHALEAWGYRLGEMKGEYNDDFKAMLASEGVQYEDGMEWLHFNEEMMEYNVQDVVVTKALFEKLVCQSYYFPNESPLGHTEAERFWNGSLQCVKIEHDAAWLLAKMERNGYPVDREGLEKLYAELAGRRGELLVDLTNTFGSWYAPKGGTEQFLHPRTGKPLSKYPRVKTPKTGDIFVAPKNKKQREGLEPCALAKTEFMKGAPYTPVQHVTFNPSSRDHIQRVLQLAGWIPTEFTDAGAPKVDDEVLEGVRVDDPVAQRSIELIQEYLMLQKRIGQVAEGVNGWLRMIQEDGRIHGSVNPNGAVTGRATHSFPNVAQVPSGKKPYGVPCRSAFGAEHNKTDGKPNPWIQVGVDASGLELRCLGHFMYRYDEGEYVETILTGDIHTKNQLAAGLPTRDNAKTFIYGFLYGAGPAKIGQIVNGTAEDGKRLIKNFLEQTPAIAALRKAIQSSLVESSTWRGGEQKVVWKRRWIRGLDGRKVHVRSPHAALNTVLQSAGAIICKLWIIETERLLLDAGLKHGWDGDFAYMAWVHDEIQVACRTREIAEIVKVKAQEAMRLVGEIFEFRCQLDTEGNIGANWNDCH
ncbi:DNA polymerase I [Yersinia phage fPS-53]|uniref:DNA polymerase n=4 Tax=Helsettvirus TaxID=2732684 RepID=A0A2H1UJ75_9CAUD|nr:DNA polymerase I [Yersinia phage fPS-53]YP_009799198.1 DNA polymerase I [Yersinia phage fPS-54-ocr]SOO46606.1 phage DNA Polymerase [Yersinia phage fPS-89]SOO56438.1 phage DNA Polymerase [Yersinia phage fPS-85]SOO56488.1 DNA Polymerase [Yersinia phage fPS-53]SOP75988.1 DNA polymerase [Yersinia phage fPS-54-ocr]